MTHQELARLHAETLFTADDAGRLLTVNEPGGAPAPRLLVVRTPSGSTCWTRHDVAPAVAESLERLATTAPISFEPDVGLESAVALLRSLEAEAPVRRTWIGPGFHFPDSLSTLAGPVRVTSANADVLEPLMSGWREDAEQGVPMTACVQDGRAVSLCCSVRLGGRAHEAGVETHPDYRHRGYAAAVTAAWAALVRDEGVVPLYSTSWENSASIGVARSLGLIHYATTFHAT